MSNKSTEKTQLQERLVKSTIQSQVAKIKKEEDEELWISGEELYTEGSSDEEDSKIQSQLCKTNNGKHETTTMFKKPDSASKVVNRRGRPHTFKDTSKLVDTSVHSKTITHEGSKNGRIMPPTESDRGVNTNVVNREEESANANANTDVDSSEISWKARRGTIVLPDTNLENQSGTDKS